MRRLIASIAVVLLLAVGAGPAFARGTGMACCRGGPAMACCLPGPGCAMKACPAPEAAALSPGLPPAIVDAAERPAPPLPAARAAAALVPSPHARPLSPPELPPRG